MTEIVCFSSVVRNEAHHIVLGYQVRVFCHKFCVVVEMMRVLLGSHDQDLPFTVSHNVSRVYLYS